MRQCREFMSVVLLGEIVDNIAHFYVTAEDEGHLLWIRMSQWFLNFEDRRE
jgi:hypothetical protein